MRRPAAQVTAARSLIKVLNAPLELIKSVVELPTRHLLLRVDARPLQCLYWHLRVRVEVHLLMPPLLLFLLMLVLLVPSLSLPLAMLSPDGPGRPPGVAVGSDPLLVDHPADPRQRLPPPPAHRQRRHHRVVGGHVWGSEPPPPLSLRPLVLVLVLALVLALVLSLSLVLGFLCRCRRGGRHDFEDQARRLGPPLHVGVGQQAEQDVEGHGIGRRGRVGRVAHRLDQGQRPFHVEAGGVQLQQRRVRDRVGLDPGLAHHP